jgi:osmotically-inducible protein OsmY
VLRGDHIKAEPHGNAVLLHGRVRSLAEREEAKRSALSVPGVAEVEDDLKVGS